MISTWAWTTNRPWRPITGWWRWSPSGIDDYWYNNVVKGVLPEKEELRPDLLAHPLDAIAGAGGPHHVLNLIPEGFYRVNGTDWDREKRGSIGRTIASTTPSSRCPGWPTTSRWCECFTSWTSSGACCCRRRAIYDLQAGQASETVFRPSARSKSIRGSTCAATPPIRAAECPRWSPPVSSPPTWWTGTSSRPVKVL